MQRWKGWFAVAALGAAAMGWSACAAGTPSSALAGGSGGVGSGGVGSAGTTASGDDAGDSGGPSFLDASPCDDRCSADLHAILDCNGAVVTTCPPDQGCGATGCVPACEAAQANQSTIGCDYYSLETDVISDLGGGTLCAAAYVTNTWTTPVTIQVERGGTMIDAASIAYLPQGSGQSITYEPLPNGELAPGQVAILFLAGLNGAPIGACPPGVNIAVFGGANVEGTGIGQAFHITTSAPVVMYDMLPYGGGSAEATSATLLLPTAVWGTSYVAVEAYPQSTPAIPWGGAPSMNIVAAEDGTTVTLNPIADIVGGNGVAPTSAGTAATYHLDRGQYLQLSQPAELTGSTIQSDKPIGVWGGSSCLNIDVDTDSWDSAHQQIPPVHALGHEYVAVRYRNRFDGQEESPPWRMVGAVDGTVLAYDPLPPTGAPSTLSAGQVVTFRAAGPFEVSSQDAKHPFYMSAHMTGCEEVDPSGLDCRGDPEFVNLIPPQQYLSSYVFFTDPTYPETNLVLVRQKTTSGFQDVTLDCAGLVTGWTQLDAAGKYQYTRVDLVTGDFEPVGACDNGRHEITSSGPFGLTVWGWGSAATGGEFGMPGPGGFFTQKVSYAYPAGASVQPINTIVLPQTK